MELDLLWGKKLKNMAKCWELGVWSSHSRTLSGGEITPRLAGSPSVCPSGCEPEPPPRAPSPCTSHLPQKEGGFGCGASAARADTPGLGATWGPSVWGVWMSLPIHVGWPLRGCHGRREGWGGRGATAIASLPGEPHSSLRSCLIAKPRPLQFCGPVQVVSGQSFLL